MQSEDETEREDDAKSQNSDWSSSAFGRNPDESRSPGESKFVFSSQNKFLKIIKILDNLVLGTRDSNRVCSAVSLNELELKLVPR